MNVLIIGIGGAIGALFRYSISLITPLQKSKFPLSTFIVNIIGSFLLGIFVHLYEATLLSNTLWTFLGIGFCGAFTTFSTFGLETITLLEQKRFKTAFLYVFGSLFCGLLATLSGLII